MAGEPQLGAASKIDFLGIGQARFKHFNTATFTSGIACIRRLANAVNGRKILYQGACRADDSNG